MKNIKNNIMRTTILILLWAFIGSFSGFANNYYDEEADLGFSLTDSSN